MSTILFETPRLRCRRLLDTDLADLVAVYGDSDAMRWVGDGRPLNEADCRRWLAITAGNYRRYGYGMSTLTERATDHIVGFCGLVHPDGQREPEIKYALRRSAWGRGFATEAAIGMLRYGADAHGMRRIIATAAPEHQASHRVLLKAGMRPAGIHRNEDGSFTALFVWAAGAGRST